MNATITTHTEPVGSLEQSLLSVIFPASVPPLLQFILLKTRIPTAHFTIPLVLFCVLYPMFTLDPQQPMYYLVMGTYIMYYFRMTDVACLPREMTQWWGIMDYLEFTFAFDTKQTRDHNIAQIKKRIEKNPKDQMAKRQLSRIIAYKDMDYAFHVKLFKTKMMELLVAQVLIKFIKLTRTEWNPPVLGLLDYSNFRDFRDYLFLSIALSIGLDFGFTIMGLVASHLFQSPFVPVMDHPFLSSSLRDFWSLRWNSVIQRCLKRVAFDPIMSFSGYKGKRAPMWITMLAAFSTFFVSACMHEWMIYIMTSYPSTWEQFFFFTLHGVMSIIETTIATSIQKATGFRILDDTPYPILWVYSTIVTPFFFNPFIRDGSFINLSFWFL
ncbi:hypothetical protein EDD86DRAFT_249751 [Gorgonomyces haynaldii]|nr:hypothetical protein EDD86DRAFT_249751 [Gorgonomyces haynaldii]